MESSTQELSPTGPQSNGQEAVPQEQSPVTPSVSDKDQLQAFVIEQEKVCDVLQDFKDAIKNCTFEGRECVKLAQGLAFLDAVIAQNKAHVKNLLERLKAAEKNG